MCTRVTDMQIQTLNVYSHIHVFSVPWTLRIYNSKKEHFIKNVYMEWYFNMHQTTFCSSFAYIRFPTLPCLVFPYGIICDVVIYMPLATDKDNKETKESLTRQQKQQFIKLTLWGLFCVHYIIISKSFQRVSKIDADMCEMLVRSLG